MKSYLMAAATAWMAIACAAAAEPVTLKLASVFADSHPLMAEAARPFAEAVTAATDGEVRFEFFPSGQLGKDPLTQMGGGLADVVVLAAAYSPAKFPLTSVGDLPGQYASSCKGTARLWTLAQPGGVLDRDEYAALGFRVLFVNQPPPYKIMTAKRPVSSMADVAGLKLRAIGFAQGEVAREMGAVPVQVPAPDMYDAFSRGTADGAIYAYGGMPAFDLGQVVHHATEGADFGSSAVLYAISEKSWARLSPEQQVVLSAEGQKIQDRFCAWFDEYETSVQKEYVAAGGLTVTPLPQEARAALQEIFGKVAQKWAETMELSGKPGRAVLAAYEATQ